MSQIKVLVCGSTDGKFEALFKRISLIQSKSGPFEMLLCTGEFFCSDTPEENDKILGGELVPPIPTYVLGPCSSKTQDFYPSDTTELGPNLVSLGRRGFLTTASGLTLAYLSGVESEEASPSTFVGGNLTSQFLLPTTSSPSFTNGVDVLMTFEWPSEADKYANSKPSVEIKGSDWVSKSASILMPRYHFAASARTFYEGPPYRNHRVLQEAARHCTRFIGLAEVGNDRKEKWLYAFNIVPMREISGSELTRQPPNVTEFPYANSIERISRLEAQWGTEKRRKEQFFFDTNAPPDSEEGGRKRRRGGRDGQEGTKRPAQPCWFCLSSPDVEKHMVISIGECCYLAMAKGPLTDDHVLILPIGHIQSYVAAGGDVRKELDKFKKSLKAYYEADGRAVVFFERNYRTQHAQMQCVDVERDHVSKLAQVFLASADSHGFQLDYLPDDQKPWAVVDEGCPYLYLDMPDGKQLFTRQVQQFPLQFVREVLSCPSVLNIPEKVDWRHCASDKEVETKMASEFRKRFSKFDFTLDNE